MSEAQQALERARGLVASGSSVTACRLVERILPSLQEDPVGLASAAHVLLTAGSYGAALRCAQRSKSLSPHDLAASQPCFDVFWTLGRAREAVESLEVGLAHGASCERWVQASRLIQGYGEHEKALGWLEAGLRVFPDSPELLSLAVESATKISQVEQVISFAGRLARTGEEAALDGAYALLRVGASGELERVIAAHATQATSWVVLRGHFALWAGKIEEARRLGQEASSQGARAEGALLGGAACILGGEVETGLQMLETVPDSGLRAVWQSEALRLLGRYGEAYRVGQRGLEQDGTWCLAAHANVLLARFELDDLDGQNTLDLAAFAPVVDALLPLSPGFDVVWTGKVGAVRALLTFALERFGGNRSATATTMEPEGVGGALAPYVRATLSDGEWAKSVLRGLVLRGRESTERVLRERLEATGSDAVRMVLAELLLRAGEDAAARDMLEGSLAKEAAQIRACSFLKEDPKAVLGDLGASEEDGVLLLHAEAHFRLGAGEKATALLRRCRELEQFGVRGEVLSAACGWPDSPSLADVLAGYPGLQLAVRAVEGERDKAMACLDLMGGFVSREQATMRLKEGEMGAVAELPERRGASS